MQRVLGKPHTHKLGVTRDMVVRLLRTNPTTILDLRNKLACCTMTIGIMRPVEGSLAQTCDYEQDSDRNKGLTQFDGGSTLRTLFRKNDQIRKGHEMRFGSPPTPTSTSTTSSGCSWISSAPALAQAAPRARAPDDAAPCAHHYSQNFNLTPPASTSSQTTQHPRPPSCPPWS